MSYYSQHYSCEYFAVFLLWTFMFLRFIWLFVCLSVCMCCVLRGWKRMLHSLGLELQVIVSGKRLETKFQSSGRTASGSSLQTPDFYFKTSWLLTRSGIAGSYGSSVFNRLNCQFMLQGSSTILQIFYFFLNNCYYLIFLIILTLVGVKCFLMVAVFPLPND